MIKQNRRVHAVIDGMVTHTEQHKINVFPVFEVNGDVDYSVGNIDFVGSVVIRGNVLPGFKIKAAGDIRITGGIEAADVEAEGSITVREGILGQNKGLVKAGKDIKSAFIQEGNIEAGGNVHVSQSIMHSRVRARHQVNCQGTKGLIVGGSIQAGESVSARTIGNSISTHTVIEVGVLPELRNELLELRNALKLHLENMDKSSKALYLLDQMAADGRLSPERLAMRIKLNHSKKQLEETVDTVKERILEIEKSLENTDHAKVEVTSIIYGGTKVVVGRYTRFIKDQASRVLIRLVDGEIVMLSKFSPRGCPL